MPTNLKVLSFYALFSKNYLDKFESILKKEVNLLPKFREQNKLNYFDSKKELIRTFRYSFFLRAYAYFESYLINECNELMERYQLKLSINDIQGKSLLKRIDKYFTKVAGLRSPEYLRSWGNLIVYNHLRNIIIHKNGYVDDLNKYSELKVFMKNTKLISIDKENHIYLNKLFNFKVISNLSHFIQNYKNYK